MWDDENSQYLVCVESSDGNEAWRYRVDSNFVSSWGDGPMSTPLADDGIIFSVSAWGKIHAVDANGGSLIWCKDLVKDFGLSLPNYGYAPSPLVYGDNIFIQAGGKKRYAFIALNKKTGKLNWHSQSDEAAYSSPILSSSNDQTQVIFMSASGLFCLSPDKGKLLWEYEWNALCPSAGPMNSISPFVFGTDTFFVSGGSGSVTGAAVVKLISYSGKADYSELWYNQEMNNVFNPSVFVNGYIYGFHGKKLRCIDVTNGTVMWETKGFGNGSIIAIEDRLIALSEKGVLALIETTPEKFTEISTMKILDGRCWTPPSIANGRLYVRNQYEIVCLDIRSPSFISK